MIRKLKLKKSDEEKLTDKQKMFCAAYAVDFDKFKAVKAAGYKGSDTVLQVMSCKLLKMPHVKKAIDAILIQQQDENRLERKHVLKKVAENLDFDLWVLEGEEGVYDRLRQIPKSAHAAIDGFEVKQLFVGKDIDTISMQKMLTSDLRAVLDGDEEAFKRLTKFFKGVRAQKIRVRLSPRAQIQDMAMRHVGAYAPDKVDLNAKVASVDLSHLFSPPAAEVDPIELAILDVKPKENDDVR